MEQIYYLITATLSKIRMWLGLVLPVILSSIERAGTFERFWLR